MMPQAWSKKDERQYEHIKRAAKRRGKSAKVAKRIAAATTNKQRSSEGRTIRKSNGRSRKKSTR
jgi:hypothetical protein